MVTLSSCLIISFIPLRWEVDQRSTYRRCRFWQKKNYLFRWSSFWSWRVCKQAKLLHLGHREPHAYIETPTHPKQVIPCCGFWSRGIIEPFFFENEQGAAVTVNGKCYRARLKEFLLTKINRRILATFGFNRTVLRATQPKLHSMFCALFL